MEAVSSIAGETIAAGLGLGVAAAAAFTSAPVSQGSNLPESVNQDVSQSMQMDAMAKEIQALEQENVWTQEFIQMTQAAEVAETAWSHESIRPEMVHAWETATAIHSGQEIVPDELRWAEELNARQCQVESLGYREEVQVAQNWANEYDFHFKDQDLSSSWANEFAAQHDPWQKFENAWAQLAEESQGNSWLSPTNSALNQEYKFREENKFRNSVDPLSEGKRILEQGNIPSAVLAFEAGVQRNPNDPNSWLLLGMAQAQNEQDTLAISALNQALKIQPENLGALLALGASLTNEAYLLQAAQALKSWLKANPKFRNLVQETATQPIISSILPRDQLKNLQASFIQAARFNPNEVDPDVQSGLGILFNLENDYEKAADCFQAALTVRPNDSLLWNRLGATMANGGKSAEAISAYRRALELSPGFIRTRYNLGVSCINLGSYKEAAEHFLIGLNQQANRNQSSLTSDSIWNSLRMVLNFLDRGDLTSAVDARDLETLNTEFGL